MIWFTSDTHFGHYNIMKYCNRPFETVEEMDECLITNWNANVKKNDTIYHLGDFCWAKYHSIEYYYNKLNGKKFLIMGNHDKKYLSELRKYFENIYQLYEIKYNNNYIVMCHYGMRVWNRSHYGAMMVYGHSHDTLPPIRNSFDVGVDANNFTPVSIDYIISRKEEVYLEDRCET